MDRRRLAEIEGYVLGLFRDAGTDKLLAREIFGSTPLYANADLVRAFEDLEKHQRLLVRYTDEGEDRVRLTPEGAHLAGLPEAAGGVGDDDPPPHPHPPKSAT